MKKKVTLIIAFIVALAIVGMVGLGAYTSSESYRKKEAGKTTYTDKIDSLPSLEQVKQMEDEAELNGYITSFTKAELGTAWGEPNESSTMEDVWYIDANTKIVVNYHNNDDKAVICSIVRTEQ